MESLSSKKNILQNLKDDMILFGKVIMPNMFVAESPDFHYTIGDALADKKEKQINIIAPRGHAKSSIVGGVFPLHHIFFDKGPKLIVLVSRTQDHAIKLLGTIKDALDYSEQLRSVFGYWGMNSARSWAKSEVELKDGSMIICKGTGQQLRGIKHGNQRPTLIILDDPEDENNTKTAEAMETNLRWLLQSAVPSLDPIKGRLAVIGTPIHQRCIVETLKDMKGWKNMCFRPDMDNNKALWEEWQPIKKLKEKKEELQSIGRVSVFYREYLCEVVGDEDQLFKEEYVQNYEGKIVVNDNGAFLRVAKLNDKETNEERPVNIFMGIDPASSTKQTADFSTIVPVAVDKDGNRFVLPYFRKRVSPMVLADNILQYAKLYKPTKTRIESVGYQEMLREYVRARCEEEGMFISGMEIKENPRNSKSSRLETMEPIFAQKKVYITTEMTELKDELLLYPRSKHDDLLDGMYYAMKNCYIPHHTGTSSDKTTDTNKRRFLTKKSWMTA
jgi:predicted phage terminase large subunit-like protein